MLDIDVPDDATIHSIVIGALLDGAGTPGSTTSRSRSMAAASRGCRWIHRHRRARTSPGWHRGQPRSFPTADSPPSTRSSGSATIIGLGESTHGTHEFFQTKARLLEHLVRTQGVRVFGIEANQLAAEQINRYVQGGEGSARDAMGVLFRVWYTEEVLALVEWLRHGTSIMRARWCASPGSTCRITGRPRIRCAPSWRGPIRRSSDASTRCPSSTGHRRDPPCRRFPTRSEHAGCPGGSSCCWR